MRILILLAALWSGAAFAQQADMFTRPTPNTQCGAEGWGYMMVGDRTRLTYLSGEKTRNRRVDERGWWVPCDMPGQAAKSCWTRSVRMQWTDPDTKLTCRSYKPLAGRLEHGATVRLPAFGDGLIGAGTFTCTDGTIRFVAGWCSSPAR